MEAHDWAQVVGLLITSLTTLGVALIKVRSRNNGD